MARYYSTRTDVERILGEPVMDENVYDSPDGRAIITYSHAQQCEDGVPGIGNIPRDKVIEIYLSLATPTKISDVLVPEKQYIQIRAVHTPTTYYEDDTEGIRYSVNDRVVNSIDYFASSETRKKFTCAEYKYAAPVPANLDAVRIEQYPFDRYGKILFEDAKARLDNFMIQLFESNKDERKYLGFIIVYAGQSAYVGEAQSMADCSKNYLIKVREADPDTIIAVDGGYQDEFRVELYILPKNAYPPLLMPTVSPKKVKILDGNVAPCRHDG